MKHPLRLTLSLAAVAALVPGAAAQAQTVKVTGEQTTVTLAPAAGQALTAAGIAVAPLAPATAPSATSLSFPIAGGRVNPATNRGFVRHRGGFSLTKGAVVVKLRHPVLHATGSGGFLSVRVERRRCQLRKLVRRVVRAHQRGEDHVRRTVVRYVRHHCVGPRGFTVRAFRLSGLQRTDQAGKAVVTVNLALTRRAASLLNRAFGTSFAAGSQAGTATATITVAS